MAVRFQEGEQNKRLSVVKYSGSLYVFGVALEKCLRKHLERLKGIRHEGFHGPDTQKSR